MTKEHNDQTVRANTGLLLTTLLDSRLPEDSLMAQVPNGLSSDDVGTDAAKAMEGTEPSPTVVLLNESLRKWATEPGYSEQPTLTGRGGLEDPME